jgi:outer membrane biosynthesis protein TonB
MSVKNPETTMTNTKRAGLVAAAIALIGAGACGKNSQPVDGSLKADLDAVAGNHSALELAPASAKSQMIVSAIEGGPKASPAPASRQTTPKPTPRPAARVAQRQQPAPAPQPVEAEAPAPAPQEAVIENVPAPRPSPVRAPMPAPQQDKRVYKTEAEIFRQMPWIKP